MYLTSANVTSQIQNRNLIWSFTQGDFKAANNSSATSVVRNSQAVTQRLNRKEEKYSHQRLHDCFNWWNFEKQWHEICPNQSFYCFNFSVVRRFYHFLSHLKCVKMSLLWWTTYLDAGSRVLGLKRRKLLWEMRGKTTFNTRKRCWYLKRNWVTWASSCD